MDDAGQLYWNDEFIFEVDPTSTIMLNREAMWNQMDIKYQAGAFGPIGELQTLLNYWTFMEESDYPNASKIKQIIQNQLEEQKAQAEAQQQNQIMQALQQLGVQNGSFLPQM